MNSLEKRSLPPPRKFFSSVTCAWTFQKGQNIMIETFGFSRTSYLSCQVGSCQLFFPLCFYPSPQKILLPSLSLSSQFQLANSTFFARYIGHLFLLFCVHCWVVQVQKFCAFSPEFLPLTLSCCITRKNDQYRWNRYPTVYHSWLQTHNEDIPRYVQFTIFSTIAPSSPKLPLALIWTYSPTNWLNLFLPSSNLCRVTRVIF